MIRLTAQIDLIGGKDPLQLFGVDNYPRSSASSSPYAVLNKRIIMPKSIMLLGVSRFSDMAGLSSGQADYFIGGVNADAEGNVQPLTLNLYGITTQSVTIAFDTIYNRHPKSITANGKVYYDDDAVFTISDVPLYPNIPDHIEITIDNWNAPNYPIVITGIYQKITLDINKRNLISMERTIKERSDYNLPSFGIISNSAQIEFRDADGEVKDYAEKMLLTSDLDVRLYISDTLSNKSRQIGKFETREWDYDAENRTVAVSLKDDLEEWQDIAINQVGYNHRNPTKVFSNLGELYTYLHSETPDKYEMLPLNALDEATRNHLNSCTVPYPLLRQGSLWEQWDKLCVAGSSYIYKTDSGKTTCVYRNGA